MEHEAEVAAMREALQGALQSHVRLGKACPCDCSLCAQIRDALKPGIGARYADRIREECAGVADWKATQLESDLRAAPSPEAASLKLMQKVAKEIASRIRAFKGRAF